MNYLEQYLLVLVAKVKSKSAKWIATDALREQAGQSKESLVLEFIMPNLGIFNSPP
jgi:hypothetical protein